MVATRYKVFVSSTYEDLKDERAQLLQAIAKKFIPLGMEYFEAETDPPWRQITADLDEAHFYVLLVGARYGSLVEGTDESWTEREYMYARSLDRPILVFIQLEAATVPSETADAARQRAFKARLRKNHTCKDWRNVEALKLAVGEALQAQLERRGSTPPEYSSSENQKVALLLDRLLDEKRGRLERDLDITHVQAEIFDAKRRLREGGRLDAGDQLSEGRLLLRRIVGRGGFATVWLAFDKLAHQDVAVRVLHGELARDRSSRERFLRGARKMTELQHPRIATVLEPPRDEDGWCYLVLPYYERGDLRRAVLARDLDIEGSLRALLDAAEGLSHAHNNGVIHRDVTPANILLDLSNRGVMADFDLVRANDTTGGTRTGAMGKFVYVAPEVLRGCPEKFIDHFDLMQRGLAEMARR